jgi:hypothetical protein
VVLPLTGTQSQYRVDKGLLFPLLAAHRALLQVTQAVARWRLNPFRFFDEGGPDLVGLLFEEYEKLVVRHTPSDGYFGHSTAEMAANDPSPQVWSSTRSEPCRHGENRVRLHELAQPGPAPPGRSCRPGVGRLLQADAHAGGGVVLRRPRVRLSPARGRSCVRIGWERRKRDRKPFVGTLWGIQSHPVEPGKQPEASLASVGAIPLTKRRQPGRRPCYRAPKSSFSQ